MDVYHHKDFMHSLRKLRREGGKKAKAAKDVEALLFRLQEGEPDPFKGVKVTKHGESRLRHCVKYDLTDFCRLVTVFTNGCLLLLFTGDHEDTDRWLENNKGRVFGLDSALRLGTTSASDPEAQIKISAKSDIWSGKLLDRLPSAQREQLLGDLKFKDIMPIQTIDAGTSEAAIEYQISHIADTDLRTAIYDVLVILNSGDVESASNRVDYYIGSFRRLDQLSRDEVLEIKLGTEIKKIEIGSEEYRLWLRKYIETEHPFEWFLFMHPEQEGFVDRDFTGPAKLSGVSGSGKTSIVIKRAIRLARLYPTERILILTLNRALSELISEIVDYACSEPEVRQRIEVSSLFALWQKLLKQFEPGNVKLYSDVTWGLEEHKDEVYREYYRCLNNNTTAELLLPTHRLLISQGVDAERYIAEEFDWIRSAVSQADRTTYISMIRKGRGYPLLEAHRQNVLAGLEGWEQKMRDVGVVDYMGLTMALSKHVDNIVPQYRSIVLDEVQDFGTTELAIIRRLVGESENDMFLCGDAAQHILPKHQILEQAGIDTRGRSFRITRNYRNSREILDTAYKLFIENLSEHHLDNSEFEICDPQYANRSSAEPLALEAATLEEEIAAALQLLKENEDSARQKNRVHYGCIAIAGYSQFEVAQFGEEIGVPVLDGQRQFFKDSVFLSDLEQTKGYEFDTMVIVNCSEEALPPLGVPEEDIYRHATQLYVALTRAREQLVLSYSRKPSRWITNEKVGLSFAKWSDVIDTASLAMKGMPGILPEFPDHEQQSVRDLTGRQFGYTPYARGLEASLLEKVDEIIRGKSVLRGGQRIEWKNVGQLMDDFEGKGSARLRATVFGPKADGIVRERFSEAQLGLKPFMRRKQPSRGKPPAADLPSTDLELIARGKADQSSTPSSSEAVRQNDKHSLVVLNLPAKHLALLHNLKLRSLEDLSSARSHVLEEVFTAMEAKALQSRARQLLESAGKPPIVPDPFDVSLEKAGVGPRAVSALKHIKVRTLRDLARTRISVLRRLPTLGKTEILQIQRIAQQNGLELLD